MSSTSRQSAPIGNTVAADLIAVLVAVTDGEPRVMTIRDASALPSGPFELGHRSLQSGLRDWVEQQTRHPLGYVEQLYTFADRDRSGEISGQRAISISYLGLTREDKAHDAPDTAWCSWYDYFPWEDFRAGVPRLVGDVLVPPLRAWAEAATEPAAQRERWRRAAITFGLDGTDWNEELVLQRYELLFEAGLMPEASRSHPANERREIPGRPMLADHRRILAKIGRAHV